MIVRMTVVVCIFFFKALMDWVAQVSAIQKKDHLMLGEANHVCLGVSSNNG